MDTRLATALSECLGLRVPPGAIRPIGGGDIGDSHMVELADGTRIFAKSYGERASAMIEAEAAGLRWLEAASAIRIPRVIATNAADPSLLVLEWIETGRPAADHDEQLGRSLAALHQSDAPAFGFASANFIGRLPQSNTAHDDWPTFYAHERIEPQLRIAVDAGMLSSPLAKRAFNLLEKLPELCGPAEPPARLHGDLWSGNHLVDDAGQPCLIDPAVYGGHREMDLAMMQLFGGFSERVFAAYDETHPLAPGHAERVPLCQLYPMLVHVNLFGGGYVGSVERILTRYT